MSQLIRLDAGRFFLDDDRFTVAADDLPAPQGDVIVSLARFHAEGDVLRADGRAFTSARLLRERYGFRGEVRAVGDVLREQAGFMVRCGFDAFAPADGSTPEQWAAAANRFRHVYQRAADDREPAFVEREHGAAGGNHGLRRG